MVRLLPELSALLLIVVIAALTSCGPSAEEKAAVAGCENAVREKAEVPQSVSFGQILHDHNFVLREEKFTIWSIHGEFTQQVGDRFVVPHFYSCDFVSGAIGMLTFFTGHAADYDKAAARSMCHQAIAQRPEASGGANFGSDLPESASGTLPYWRFEGTVDLMNGSDTMIPHHYYCYIDHGEFLELELTEED